MKTDVKKTLILLGVVSIIALSTWAIQTRDGKGYSTDRQKEICTKHGTYIPIGDNDNIGTCVCKPGYMGFLCDEIDPTNN